MSRSLAILGTPAIAIDLALRRVLSPNGPPGLLVMDWSGRGAPLLNETNRGRLKDEPPQWFDLANRQRPVRLFALEKSDSVRETVSKVLLAWREIGIAPKKWTVS